MQESCHSVEGYVANEQLTQRLSAGFEHVPFSKFKSTTSLFLVKVCVFSHCHNDAILLRRSLFSLQDFASVGSSMLRSSHSSGNLLLVFI